MDSVGGPFDTDPFYGVPPHPTRSGPGATIMHSVGGPFATRISTCFRRTPARSGPGAGIMDSVWGAFATGRFRHTATNM